MTAYEIRDNCYGTVNGHCYGGACILLDNGQAAFARGAGLIRMGTRVLCTVTRNATANDWMLVSIDSVEEMEVYA